MDTKFNHLQKKTILLLFVSDHKRRFLNFDKGEARGTLAYIKIQFLLCFIHNAARIKMLHINFNEN